MAEPDQVERTKRDMTYVILYAMFDAFPYDEAMRVLNGTAFDHYEAELMWKARETFEKWLRRYQRITYQLAKNPDSVMEFAEAVNDLVEFITVQINPALRPSAVVRRNRLIETISQFIK